MRFVLAFFMVLFFMNFASSVAVTSLYSDVKPLLAEPGESLRTYFVLSNMLADAGEVRISAEFAGEQGIAELLDDEYKLEAGEEVEAGVRINIPEDAKFGDEYSVRVLFRIYSLDSSSDGNIQFVTGLGAKIPVVVGTPSESPAGENKIEAGLVWFWALIVLLLFGILAIGFAIFYSFRRRSADYY